MKRAVSISLGSSERNKKVEIDLKGQTILTERIGTDGDWRKAQQLFTELDGKVDALSMGGLDMYLRLEGRRYPLYAALKLVKYVRQTPVADGSGLKHTLERRVFELAEAQLGGIPHFKRAFMPVAVDRPGMAQAAEEVSDEVIYGDLMVDLNIPIPIKGMKRYRQVARLMLPFVSHFPMSMLFYGSSGTEYVPKYEKFWDSADLLIGDYLFMAKHMPLKLPGKTVVTNTTTETNVETLRERGVRTVITTTPRYEGRSFGTNMMEAVLIAYAGKGRVLEDDELNALIDELELRPTVTHLNL